jgi:hypothetical protein
MKRNDERISYLSKEEDESAKRPVARQAALASASAVQGKCSERRKYGYLNGYELAGAASSGEMAIYRAAGRRYSREENTKTASAIQPAIWHDGASA